MKDEIKYPPSLTEECNNEIKKAFSEYGNSWVDNGFWTGWWIDRIEGELEELKQCNNHEERRKELLDIINVCRMMYHNEDGAIKIK